MGPLPGKMKGRWEARDRRTTAKAANGEDRNRSGSLIAVPFDAGCRPGFLLTSQRLAAAMFGAAAATARL